MKHLDIVQRVYAEQPAEKTVDGAFAFLLRLLPQLPAEERAGLLSKPTGGNIMLYKSQTVSVGRVCYPNGKIFKVLSDIPGTNGPEWLDDNYVDPGRYIPFVAVEPPAPVDPPPPPAPVVDLSALSAQFDALKLQAEENTAKILDAITRLRQEAVDAGKNLQTHLPDLLKILGR